MPFSCTLEDLSNDTKYIEVWPTRRWLLAENLSLLAKFEMFLMGQWAHLLDFRCALSVIQCAMGAGALSIWRSEQWPWFSRNQHQWIKLSFSALIQNGLSPKFRFRRKTYWIKYGIICMHTFCSFDNKIDNLRAHAFRRFYRRMWKTHARVS